MMLKVLFHFIFIATVLLAFLLLSPSQIHLPSSNKQNGTQPKFLMAFNLLGATGDQPVTPTLKEDITFNGFKGDWFSPQPPFDYFGGSTGTLRLYFEDYDQNSSLPDTLVLEFLDGKYLDNKVIQIKNISLNTPIQYGNMSDPTNTSYLVWTGSNNVTLEEYNSMSLDQESGTTINYTLNITNAEATDYSEFRLLFKLTSDLMNIDITAVLTWDTFGYSMQAFLYALSVSIICIVEIIIIYRLIKISLEDESMISKISILTIGWEYTTDTYLCLFHLWIAIYRPDFFHFFIVPTILFFILASIFEMRLLMFLWKARYYATYQNVNDLRRGLILFFVKLYIVLFVVLILLYFFILINWFIIILHLFLLPQIYHTAKSCRSPKSLNLYLLPFTVLRLFLPVSYILLPQLYSRSKLYFRGCPTNLFLISPSLTFDIVIGCLMGIQLLLCLFQWAKGPRCFIPAIFLPPKYNYYITYTVALGLDAQSYDDCAICMCHLHEEPQSNQNQNPLEPAPSEENSQDQPLLINNPSPPPRKQKTVSKKIMKTPCDHKFHIPCLKEWLNIKLECPTCRKQIPSLE